MSSRSRPYNKTGLGEDSTLLPGKAFCEPRAVTHRCVILTHGESVSTRVPAGLTREIET